MQEKTTEQTGAVVACLHFKGDLERRRCLAQQVSLEEDEESVKAAGSTAPGEEHAAGAQQTADQPSPEEVRWGIQHCSLLRIVVAIPEKEMQGVKNDPAEQYSCQMMRQTYLSSSLAA